MWGGDSAPTAIVSECTGVPCWILNSDNSGTLATSRMLNDIQTERFAVLASQVELSVVHAYWTVIKGPSHGFDFTIDGLSSLVGAKQVVSGVAGRNDRRIVVAD